MSVTARVETICNASSAFERRVAEIAERFVALADRLA